MGQFKPMVKMMTTEPSVELKLKKGGSVKSMTKMKSGGGGTGHKKMADGGSAMGALAGTPALVGRPAVNAPVRTPGKPPMAQRRKAMMAKPAMPAPMKKGGKMAEGGESKKEHMAEMSKMKGLEKELKSHESKPASKAHKGLKTGGVANGQGGYKKGGATKKYAKGGIINTENQGGAYRDTKMHTAEFTGKTSGKTGGVKEGNAGGYATGGVALGNGGGYKAGGKAKKAYATGGKVEDSGRPVAMPQGRKKPSTPVSINQLAGTFKSGGKVTPAQGRLQKAFAAENKTAMKQAKAQSNEVYSKYGKKMASGGALTDYEKSAVQKMATEGMMSNANAMTLPDFSRGRSKRTSAEMEQAMKEAQEFARQITGKRSRREDPNVDENLVIMTDPPVFGTKKSSQTRELQDLFKGMGNGAVTETEKSVTVTPGKKRGGRC